VSTLALATQQLGDNPNPQDRNRSANRFPSDRAHTMDFCQRLRHEVFHVGRRDGVIRGRGFEVCLQVPERVRKDGRITTWGRFDRGPAQHA
jgi:hypothetical protein